MRTCCPDFTTLAKIQLPLACAAAAVFLLLLSSCASGPGTSKKPGIGVVYPSSSIEEVTVISRSEELTSATSGRVGGSIGSIAGSLGGGIAGTILGGVGGLIGPTIEGAVIKEKVSRYTLRRKSGEKATLLQDDTESPIPTGATAYLIRHPENGTVTLSRERPATS